ncbi:unnamed protein product [Caenorhabditis sp. 36 PRJEB53466]|nr:unnamed protein product [Caenorhabditis sp. 36 PRJEB53466]
MDSRRVSLPASLAVSHPYFSTYHHHQRQGANSSASSSTASTSVNIANSTMLLSPNFSPSPCPRRSLPSTPLPNGARRSLPATPPTPAFSSTSEQEEFFVNDEQNDEEPPEFAPRSTRLRSFDLRDGHILDKGFQKKPSDKDLLSVGGFGRRGGDSRRATCPDIFLFDSQNMLMKHVVLRIYGARNCGKKSLANRIHHFATSMAPEKVDPDENGNDYTRMTTFLLNGREVTLEILLESTLENSPFQQSKTLYIVMYNVDNKASFVYATQILERITLANLNNPVPLQVFLIGNKCDLKRNQVISTNEAKAAARHFKCDFLEGITRTIGTSPSVLGGTSSE